MTMAFSVRCHLVFVSLLSLQSCCSSMLSCSSKITKKANLESLQRAEQLLASVDHKTFTSEDGRFTLGVCSAAGWTDEAAVVESDGGQRAVIGRWNVSELHAFVASSSWFVVTVGSGDKFASGTCGGAPRNGSVIFMCSQGDTSAVFSKIDVGNPCTSVFVLTGSFLCMKPVQAGTSAFVVFIFIIVAILFAYLTLGIFYRRYVDDARGIEQIPNYETWRNAYEWVQKKLHGTSAASDGYNAFSRSGDFTYEQPPLVADSPKSERPVAQRYQAAAKTDADERLLQV